MYPCTAQCGNNMCWNCVHDFFNNLAEANSWDANNMWEFFHVNKTPICSEQCNRLLKEGNELPDTGFTDTGSLMDTGCPPLTPTQAVLMH